MPRMTKAEREKRAKMDAKNKKAREKRAAAKAKKHYPKWTDGTVYHNAEDERLKKLEDQYILEASTHNSEKSRNRVREEQQAVQAAAQDVCGQGVPDDAAMWENATGVRCVPLFDETHSKSDILRWWEIVTLVSLIVFSIGYPIWWVWLTFIR